MPFDLPALRVCQSAPTSPAQCQGHRRAVTPWPRPLISALLLSSSLHTKLVPAYACVKAGTSWEALPLTPHSSRTLNST